MNRNHFLKTLMIQILNISILFSCSTNNYKNTVNRISSVAVYYQNGDSLIGQLNYPMHLNDKEIHLKVKNEGYKKIKITQISKVVYKMPTSQKVIFEKFQINDESISKTKDKYQFLELVSKGKVDCYFGHNYGFLYKKGKKKKFLNKTNLIFCKRNNETNLTLIYAVTDKKTAQENYLQIAKKYFDIEPLINDKITSENFTIENLITIIKNNNK